MVPQALLQPPMLLPLGVGGSAGAAAAVAIQAPRSHPNRWTRNWNPASLRHSSLTPTPLAQHGDSPPLAGSRVGTPHAGREGGNGDDDGGGDGFEWDRRRQGASGEICVYVLNIGPSGWTVDGPALASDHVAAQPRLD